MTEKSSSFLNEKVLRILEEKGLNHLKVAVRASNIVIYSLHGKDKDNRCRFVKMAANTFVLHMADHRGKWEPTPFTGTPEELTELVIEKFGWVLMDV